MKIQTVHQFERKAVGSKSVILETFCCDAMPGIITQIGIVPMNWNLCPFCGEKIERVEDKEVWV
jgi:hypothetical protein